MTKERRSKSRKAGAAPEAVIDLDQDLPAIPDRTPFDPPDRYLEKDGKGGYRVVLGRRPSKTLLAEKIRVEVNEWRAKGYFGASDVSKRLLEHWFVSGDTRGRSGDSFRFYFCQQEAIETIIYLYEVAKRRDAADLCRTYLDEKTYPTDLFRQAKKNEEDARNKRLLVRVVPETNQLAHQELPPADLTRYAVKLATGAGKTIVMALAVVWSYFNKRPPGGYDGLATLADSFLVLAPNVIVFERLRGGEKDPEFEGGAIFRKYPLIPPEWRHDFQLRVVLRGESGGGSPGTLYLTNIQQLYEREEAAPVNPVDAILGPKPKLKIESGGEKLLDQVSRHENLMVLNDEAHHVHDTDLEWWKVIERLHDDLKRRTGRGLAMNLDFSATPKDQNGTFFPWIIVDYPLAQAVEDRVVKAPLIAHQTDKTDPEKYTKASIAYAEWIQIALSRWREHRTAYGRVGLNPVLFVMAENTKDADDIGEALEREGDLKGHVLIIHTDKQGEITKADVEKARSAARAVDDPKTAIRAVVSVLMLREGWDVRNVSVILGLRPFTSKANILPEQAVGRGLRLMKGIGPDYTQILELVGTNAFENFVRELEKEGVGVATTKTPPNPGTHIFVEKKRMEFDIAIPIPTPAYRRDYRDLATFDPETLPKNPAGFDLDSPEKDGKVVLDTALTQVTVAEKDVENAEPPFADAVIAYYTNRILSQAQLSGRFAEVYPIVKRYVEDRFFGRKVDLENARVRRLLASTRASEALVSTVGKAIGAHTAVKTEVGMTTESILMSETETFLWRRQIADATKTVFNKVASYNDYETRFAEFLDRAKDVRAFAKLAEWSTRFSIDYLNSQGALRQYYPDFVAEETLPDGKKKMWILETKGREDDEVPLKDARTRKWCADVTALTGVAWDYEKVLYSDWNARLAEFGTLGELITAIRAVQAAQPGLGIKPPSPKRPQLVLVVDNTRIEKERFKTLLPLYGLKAACGKFGPSQAEEEPEAWVDASSLGKLNERMFVVRAVGRSMEPRIHDGDYVVFEHGIAGTRQGKIVLAQYRGPEDPETGGNYTIKRYSSEKSADQEGESWRHEKITLSPLNKEFEAIELALADEEAVAVIGVMTGLIG